METAKEQGRQEGQQSASQQILALENQLGEEHARLTLAQAAIQSAEEARRAAEQRASRAEEQLSRRGETYPEYQNIAPVIIIPSVSILMEILFKNRIRRFRITVGEISFDFIGLFSIYFQIIPQFRFSITDSGLFAGLMMAVINSVFKKIVLSSDADSFASRYRSCLLATEIKFWITDV